MLNSIKKLYISNTTLRVIVNYVGNMMQLIVVDLTRALLQNVVQNIIMSRLRIFSCITV